MRGRAAWTGGVLDDDLRVAMYDGTLVIGRWREGQNTDFRSSGIGNFYCLWPPGGPRPTPWCWLIDPVYWGQTLDPYTKI